MKYRAYFLHNFNNYHNRILKMYSTIQDYISNSDGYEARGQDFAAAGLGGNHLNFEYKDGVRTEIVLNKGLSQEWQPDYVVVTDEYGNILHRWYVLEAYTPMNGQYKCYLKRDSLADHYAAVTTATCFIHKATIPTTNPLIYNSEGCQYNQIKDENEILLKDSTGVPWLVGYVASNMNTDSGVSGSLTHDVDYTTNDIATFVSAISQGYIFYPEQWRVSIIAEGEVLYNYVRSYYIYGNGTTDRSIGWREANTFYWRENTSEAATQAKIQNNIPTGFENTLKSTVSVLLNGNCITPAQANNTWQYNYKIVKDTSDNRFYRLSVRTITYDDFSSNISSNEASMYTTLNSIATASFSNTGHGNSRGYKCQSVGSYVYLQVQYTRVSDSNYSYTSSIAHTRRQLNDAPYCMFMIPYGDITIKNGENTVHVRGDIMRSVASTILAQLPEVCYDVQLLPYCPRVELWDSTNNRLDISDLAENKDYFIVMDSDGHTQIGYGVWCVTSTGTFNIPITINAPTDPVDLKIENETSFYRLTSPTYSDSYEFSVAKNGGINYVNIDYTYKPYNPYIHINPNFKNLYGADTNDARGLICSGDYSITKTTNQWAQYELNNVNYQKSFDRQIETNDELHKNAMWQSGIGTAAGAIGSGITTGVFGGVGLGIGAGVASAIGGAADLVFQQKNYEINKENSVAQFQFNLQNVKARPDTINKVSVFNINSKIFPFIEHYHATQEEREILRNKIIYNGMTVNAIGQINTYLQPTQSFIQATLIRIEGLSDDYHMTGDIADELQKGVYM